MHVRSWLGTQAQWSWPFGLRALSSQPGIELVTPAMEA